MLSEKNRAILLMAQTKTTKPKPKSTRGHVSTTGGAFVKPDGKAEWVRFKTECVLLSGKGKSR